MKQLFLYIFPLFILSCSTKRTKIILQDSLGTISINYHPKFDTLYQWQDYSDCNCCGYKYTRLANRKYILNRESGFLHEKKIDSLYEFSIRQPEYYYCNIDSTYKDLDFKDSTKIKQYTFETVSFFTRKVKWISEEYLKIDNHNFIVYSLEGSSTIDSLKSDKIVRAIFKHNGQDYRIEARCISKDCGDFLNEMKAIIKSLKFE